MRTAVVVGTDVEVLRSAASIENLAVATYGTLLALPAVTSTPGLASVLTAVRNRHASHAAAFNSAAVAAGGTPRTTPDASLAPTLGAAPATAPEALTAAAGLEDTAAQTYVANASLVTTAGLRTLLVSVAAVSAQDRAVLLTYRALLGAGHAVGLGPDLATLPAAAGSVGFPAAYYPVKDAVLPTEGSP